MKKIKIRKGELTLRVLEILVEIAALPINFFSLAMGPERPTVGRALWLADRQAKERGERAAYFKDLRQINNLVYKLKKAGLIQKKSGVFPLLTEEGRIVLEELRGNFYRGYLPPLDKYKVETGGDSKIMIFDIPENLKRKRDWLRLVLKVFGYKMLQKSVWLGKGIFPQRLITDLKEMGLLQYIHVLSIKDEGTIPIEDNGNKKAD